MNEFLGILLAGGRGALFAFLALINIILFLLMGYDKFQAKREGWRIPEKTLLLLGLLGGGAGGLLGMRLFHHKTKKRVFHVLFSIGILILFLLLYVAFDGNVKFLG